MRGPQKSLRWLALIALTGMPVPLKAQMATDPGPMPIYPDYSSPNQRLPERPGTRLPVPPEARASESVVAGLSHDAVGITASFDGSEILIYGAIKRETPLPPGDPLEMIVTLEGPPQSLTIRHKERRLGIWINTEQVPIGAAPSFYVAATSAPLADILNPDQDVRYRISVPLVMRAFSGPVAVSDTIPFTEALIRLREQDGIYRLDEGAVHVEQQTLFRADVSLPANLVEGTYRTRIFLLRDGNVIDEYRAPIEVRKVGLERWLYRLALDQPFLYGLLSLAIAIGAGWAASEAFRVLKRR